MIHFNAHHTKLYHYLSLLIFRLLVETNSLEDTVLHIYSHFISLSEECLVLPTYHPQRQRILEDYVLGVGKSYSKIGNNKKFVY